LVAQKEALTERLKYLTEVFRVAWVFLLATGSGTVGLWLGPRDFWRSVFAVTGVVVIVVLVLVIGTVHRRIQRLLTRLEDL
jgi:membrane protein YdbS with pleckstrin-like domain